jgi:hypothetical protein
MACLIVTGLRAMLNESTITNWSFESSFITFSRIPSGEFVSHSGCEMIAHVFVPSNFTV